VRKCALRTFFELQLVECLQIVFRVIVVGPEVLLRGGREGGRERGRVRKWSPLRLRHPWLSMKNPPEANNKEGMEGWMEGGREGLLTFPMA